LERGLLLRALFRHLPSLEWPAAPLRRIGGVALAAALVAAGVWRLVAGLGWHPSVVGGLAAAIFAAGYLALAVASKLPELRIVSRRDGGAGS
jgi:hypothetical protein